VLLFGAEQEQREEPVSECHPRPLSARSRPDYSSRARELTLTVSTSNSQLPIPNRARPRLRRPWRLGVAAWELTLIPAILALEHHQLAGFHSVLQRGGRRQLRVPLEPVRGTRL
jgi:hypothetical protein